LGRIAFGEDELPSVIGSVEESLLGRRLDGFLDWTSSVDILEPYSSARMSALKARPVLSMIFGSEAENHAGPENPPAEFVLGLRCNRAGS